MSRGRIIAAIAAVVVIALIVGGIMLSAGARTPQVSVAKVEKENLTQTVTASGQLEGDVKADVFPPTQGTLKSISVVDGQAVKAGQVLASMDTEPLDAQVAQARQAYKQAQAGLVQAERSSPGSLDRSAANAAVSAAETAESNAIRSRNIAESQLASARRALARDRNILAHPSRFPAATVLAAQQRISGEQSAVSQLEAQLPQAQTAVAQAHAGVLQAEAQRAQLKSQSAAISAAEAGVDAAAEALELAQQNLSKAVLTAPIDGIVVFAGGGGVSAAGGAAAALAGGGGAKPAVGSAVSPAAAPFTVFQLQALNFNAQVDEADIANVKVGMKGVVTLDAFPGVNFDTSVVQLKTQAIQTSTGGTAFPVLLAMKATGKRLLVGMGGNVDIQVSGIENAVTVPVEALFDEAGGTYVYVVRDNKVHRTKVKTGAMTDTRAQILEGVEPGQEVALGGLSNLKDGMTVRVK